ncbi:molecular chaperone [Franzmannia qiaohouensis]|uniref:Molecular chaperone n=1 Tax=Franzmannia qiaohouensis TaxID=1329370 RepID=A0ABU1H955_9GAMM|nr:molecular chaperone [Halomonas qiaohouensis]MDR5903992.1 molecular chaperone [Halomonas qiaohouensis]
MTYLSSRQAAYRGLVVPLFMLTLLLASQALAGSFSVSPTRVVLSTQDNVVALRVRNTGAEETSVQVELQAWRQEGGQDIYTPSREVLATPPIFTLAPGQTQMLRVGLRRPPAQDTQLSYRLFLQELPPPSADDFQGLRMSLRISLPVFVAPASGVAAPHMHWRVERGSGDEWHLSADNRGNGHGQVSRLRVRLPDGRTLQPSGNAYVLPGATQRWRLSSGSPLPAAGSELVITAGVNGQETASHLKVE